MRHIRCRFGSIHTKVSHYWHFACCLSVHFRRGNSGNSFSTRKTKIIVPLIITKIIIALIGGYAVDFVFRKSNKETLAHIKAYAEGSDNKHHNHETILEEKACCGHSTSPSSVEFNPKEIILHPIIHTAKVFIFIFIVSFAINFAIAQMGEEAFRKTVLRV